MRDILRSGEDAFIDASYVSPPLVKIMVLKLTSPELRFALRTLDTCGRQGYWKWLRFGVWYSMAREMSLPLDVEDLVASYI